MSSARREIRRAWRRVVSPGNGRGNPRNPWTWGMSSGLALLARVNGLLAPSLSPTLLFIGLLRHQPLWGGGERFGVLCAPPVSCWAPRCGWFSFPGKRPSFPPAPAGEVSPGGPAAAAAPCRFPRPRRPRVPVAPAGGGQAAARRLGDAEEGPPGKKPRVRLLPSGERSPACTIPASRPARPSVRKELSAPVTKRAACSAGAEGTRRDAAQGVTG